MLQGAIFDADGTLLDSMPIWRELGARYLRGKGLEPHAGLSDILYPMSLNESSLYLKKTYALPDSPEQITADILALIEAFYDSEVTLKPGVLGYLRFLRARHIPMIVASASDEGLLRRAFGRLGIEAFFQAILTCGALKVNKREATIYCRAAEALGTRPCDTAVFEDGLCGLISARAAGFITVAVRDESNARDWETMRATADYAPDDFEDPSLQTTLLR